MQHSSQPGSTTQTSFETRLSQAIELFYQHARIHGRSKGTMKWYAWNFKTVTSKIQDPLLSEINTPMLRSLFISLIDAGWKPTSQNMVFRVLHALFMFCIKEELLAKNPLDAIPEPKAPKLFPFTLDDNQVDALISQAPKRTRAENRNYAMLLVFLDCGLRLGEVVSLRLNDVSLAQRSLKVFGKGAKERIVFMGSRTAKAIKHWIDARGFKPHYSDRLFVDRSGNPLKPRNVQKIIFLFGRQAKLPMKLSPHKLRHVSATLAVRHGMDTFCIATSLRLGEDRDRHALCECRCSSFARGPREGQSSG